jgi:hypothetical protein
MRALILAAGAALALGACGNNDQTDNTQNVDENLTAENIVSNDVTAIDAVTGDAANMAADVNYQDFDNSVGTPSGNAAAPARPQKPATKPSTARPPDEPAPVSNAAANSTD